MVLKPALVIHLRQAHHHALAGGYVGEHLWRGRSCTIWNDAIGLPNCSRSCVYLSVCSKAPIWDAGRSPTHHVAVIRSTRAVSRNELPACRRFRFRKPDVLQGDLAVLEPPERDLLLDLLDAEAGRGFILGPISLD